MGLFENIGSDRVEGLNLREPVLVSPDMKVREVVRKMQEKDLGCAVIIDENRVPIGMFTERMLTQIMSNQPELLDQPVISQSAERWPQVKLSDPVVDVLDALEMKNVRFLAVVDADGKIAGLTGQKGLMEYVADHFPGQVMVQRVGQKPYMHKREGA
jgi:CBS domain-containing protein